MPQHTMTCRCLDCSPSPRAQARRIALLFDHIMHGHPLYRAAKAADMRYARACRQTTAGRRDRWTITPAEASAPRVQAAYRRKVQADAAWRAQMHRWQR